MTIKLYGSPASPYVRRIRMALEGIDYQMHTVNIYDDQERADFTKISPIRKLPVLVDGEQTIWDSRVIYGHLCDKHGSAHLSLDQHKLVSAIDAATDAMIILFQSANSGIATATDKLFYQLQHGRAKETLKWLESQAKTGVFDEWNYPTISMLSTITWAQFRELNTLGGYPELLRVQQLHAHRDIVKSTEPSL